MWTPWDLFYIPGSVMFYAYIYIGIRLSKRGRARHPADPRYLWGWIRSVREVILLAVPLYGAILAGSVIGVLATWNHDVVTAYDTYDNQNRILLAVAWGGTALICLTYWTLLRALWCKNPSLAAKINIGLVFGLALREVVKDHQANQQWQQQRLVEQIAASQAQAVNQALTNAAQTNPFLNSHSSW